MERLGTVLVFRPDASREDVDLALKSIAAVLDENYTLPLSKLQRYHGPKVVDKVVLAPDGDHVLAHVEEFDDRHGGPVFYIP